VFASDDTIVAIATPPGRGGIGVVRISGGDAVRIGQALLPATPLAPRHATFARVIEPVSGAALDQVVATLFQAPHSYTGEDVLEISGHGSPLLLGRIVEAAVSLGARLAEPGEFTLRAYLRGRLDLAQAEAVADLADAATPLQARAAMDQLEGTLTGRIAEIDGAIFDLTARLEASLDFPDEGFHFVTRETTTADIEAIQDQLGRLIRDGRGGRVIREGRTVVIAGRPNAGKSSLFNALVGSARAIVTDQPGTTRDLLTERVDIGGLVITLVDTAGLREARDQIEAEGVRRARDAHAIAALTLFVVDGSQPIAPEDLAFAGELKGPWLLVASKADLPGVWASGTPELPEASSTVFVSAITGEGLDPLRTALIRALTERDDLRDPPIISNVRHLGLVETAQAAMSAAAQALADGATEELIVADLTQARRALEEITGRRTADDLLERIFSRFGLGK
jgi:tRNA modification GTPase